MSELESLLLRPLLTPEELKDLSRRSPWRAALGIVRVYLLIILTLSVALIWGGWWILPAVLIIAALQHALSILQHEAVHGLLFNSHRWNEFVGTYLLSYPIGFTMDYRAAHFAHHRALGHAGDPDLPNYQKFPASPRVFLRKLVGDFSGYGALVQFFGRQSGNALRPSRLVGLLIIHAIIFAGFGVAEQPLMYFVLWVLPLLTVTKGLAQMRNLAEHVIRTNAPPGTERLRTFRSNLIERFFLAPLNFHYHAEHHWYTVIPYYRLPEARRMLQDRPGYSTYAEMSSSYLSVLRGAMRGGSFSV